MLAHQKIEVESIYDNQAKKQTKTRFTALPTKYEKTNMPVTFHKQIKSSGYSAAPGALKYTSYEKKKKEENKSAMQWAISKDFYSKPLPLQTQAETKVLSEKPLSKSSITRVKYSPSGNKLAFAGVDTMIGVVRTPIFNNVLDVTSLQGHNSPVNSLHWSSSD